MPRSLTLRPFMTPDIPAVAELDQRIFERSAWSAAAFETELTESRISLLYLLCSSPETPAALHTLRGYFVCWHLPRQLQLANIAVHPDHRRSGFGALLLQAVLRLAQRLEVETVELDVRKSNLSARRLYEQYNFRAVGERPRFYEHPTETAIMMDGPVPDQIEQRLPRRLAAAYPDGLHLHWRDRAGASLEHWPASEPV